MKAVCSRKTQNIKVEKQKDNLLNIILLPHPLKVSFGLIPKKFFITLALVRRN